MSFIIKGAKVPTICQECPCFGIIKVNNSVTDEKLLVQRCGVTKKALNTVTSIDEICDKLVYNVYSRILSYYRV